MRGAIIIILVSYCTSFFSQQISFSKNFQAVGKNVPIAILNQDSGYFYVLRYNKLAHDFVVEKRSKPGAELLAFFPLKLDQINAGWFDYEKLDYLFFEHAGRLFFVFEKVLNSRSMVYLKEVGLQGEAGGFVELAAMQAAGGISGFRFRLERSYAGQVLIISEQQHSNGTVRKSALLYDCASRRVTWNKQLPPESAETGYSRGFAAAPDNRLYYLMVKSRLSGYKRQYMNFSQVLVPRFHHDSVHVMLFPQSAGNLRRMSTEAHHTEQLNSISLHVCDTSLILFAHFTKSDPEEGTRVYFLNQAFGSSLDTCYYAHLAPLRKELADQLNFYDGNDAPGAENKTYSSLARHFHWPYASFTSGRQEESYAKEMIFWRSDMRNGLVEAQAVIPRKIHFFPGRSRFRYLGDPAIAVNDSAQYTFLLEHPGNALQRAAEFRYAKFEKQRASSGANLVVYISRQGKETLKRVLLRNSDFEYIPLPYQSATRDFVFYQVRGRVERFAILNLDEL